MQQPQVPCRRMQHRCPPARPHRAGKALTAHRALTQRGDQLLKAQRRTVFLTLLVSYQRTRTPMILRANILYREAIIGTRVLIPRRSRSSLAEQCRRLTRHNLHSRPLGLTIAARRLAHHTWRIRVTSRRFRHHMEEALMAWLDKGPIHLCPRSTATSNLRRTHHTARQCKGHRTHLRLETAAPKHRAANRIVICRPTATRQACLRSQQLEFRRYNHRKWKHEVELLDTALKELTGVHGMDHHFGVTGTNGQLVERTRRGCYLDFLQIVHRRGEARAPHRSVYSMKNVSRFISSLVFFNCFFIDQIHI